MYFLSVLSINTSCLSFRQKIADPKKNQTTREGNGQNFFQENTNCQKEIKWERETKGDL